MNRRKIRPLIFGKDGAGKSWFAATFPKPMLVCLFDPPDKALAYLERGTPSGIQQSKYCYYEDVFSTKEPEKRIIRIEYWGEVNPQKPTSHQRFISRTATLERELVEEGFETVVLDSVTGFELSARYYSEFALNANNSDARAHYAFSMKACEQFIMTRWPNLISVNAVAIAHYEEQKDDDETGEIVTTKKMIAVPGRLPNRIGTSWSECWRVYVDKQGQRRVQTDVRPGNNFACKTGMHFQDFIEPHYEELWRAKEAAVEVS